MKLQTLQRTGNELASAARQKEILADPARVAEGQFRARLEAAGSSGLTALGVSTLQVNLGKVCNQTCAHCHVDAGPDRRESMSRETVEAVLDFLRASPIIRTLDITGGAPEMNPHFRHLVEQARLAGKQVIDRCNLTILLARGFEDLAGFLAGQAVEIVASLPCYLESNCDAQRGTGVFEQSTRALQELNRLGYGQKDSGLQLSLVYNPVGTSLPPDQSRLEDEYRKQLGERFGIVFNRLYTITNMPISRFLDDLLRRGEYEAYMQRLMAAFNPATLEGLMCRQILSVDWRGRLYDCDFNQMLEMPVEAEFGEGIANAQCDLLSQRRIVTGNHCFGCTAGCGSSCQGAVV